MSFNFEVNYEEASTGGGLVAAGDYEVVVAKAKEDITKNGAEYIYLHLIIRNDLDQAHKNQYLFGSIWKGKETGQYHKGILNAVAKSLQIENGKKYNSLEEMLGDFVRKTAKVTVEHEEYNGKTNARVKGWNPSNFPNCQHTFKKDDIETSNNNSFQPVDESEIPF